MFVQCMYPVYCVLFSPLWLKSEPGWPAISVSTSQLFRVWKIVWFGWLSAISQLASRVGEGWGVGQLCLHSVTHYTALHYLAQVATAGRGVAFPPLDLDPDPTPSFTHVENWNYFFTLSLQGQIRLFSVSIRVISFKIFSILNILLKFSRKSR
jgi:hypothetical protein